MTFKMTIGIGKMAKVILKAKYKSKSQMIASYHLPRLKHLNPAYIVKSAEILAAGHFDDGTEFQDIRVIIKRGVIDEKESN